MQQIRCTCCRSEDKVKDGFYKYKGSRNQRYRCKKCGKNFEENSKSPFLRMRYPEEVIIFAIKAYVHWGLQSPMVSEALFEQFKVNVSPRTVLRWIQKFAPWFQKISKIYRPKYTEEWHIDEMFVNRSRTASKKRPGKEAYLFTVYDSERKVVATFLSDFRDAKSASHVFDLAVKEAGFYPRIVVTDKCPIYSKSLRGFRKVKHVNAHFETVVFIYKGEKVYFLNQNHIERYHSEIRPKENSMRGIKSIDCSNNFFQIYRIEHNYFRHHMTFNGMTPVQQSGYFIMCHGFDEELSWDNVGEIMEKMALMNN